MFNFNNEQIYFLISAIAGKFINLFSINKKIESILVIKLDEIGDMVYSLHVFKHLENSFPDKAITLLCKPFVKPIVENIPNIKEIIYEIPFEKRFDLIIELRGDYQTLWYAIKKKPTLRFDRGTVRILNKFKGLKKHEIYTNYDIIKPLLKNNESIIFPTLIIDKKSSDTAQKFLNNNLLTNYAVLHCGARKLLRQWSPANFASISKYLIEKYNLKIVFAGTKDDDEIIDKIISLANIDAIKCNDNFTLLNFAQLVKNATIYIGNESGPLHIAAVLNSPLVGIYGPGIKDIFYPIGNNSKVIHHVLDCNPCNQENCVRPHNPCIELVTIEEVKEKIKELLG
ncbi:MAG: glycosyltransferase family 9 protein [Bacteroidia bacterium]|nr:glycosyltransferase family 9 protein [Bacteroidia bacterium]